MSDIGDSNIRLQRLERDYGKPIFLSTQLSRMSCDGICAELSVSQKWYVKHNGKTFGPITSTKLKQLVGAAKIKPATEVRLGDDGQWIQASRVKGLLEQTKPQQQAKSTDPKPSLPNNSSTKPQYVKGVLPAVGCLAILSPGARRLHRPNARRDSR